MFLWTKEPLNKLLYQKDFVGDAAKFLQDNMIVNISSHEGKPLSIQLPDTVILTVKEAEPVLKGQTVHPLTNQPSWKMT